MVFKKWIVVFFVMCAVTVQANQLPDKPHIYVEGSAVLDVKPDIATFTVYLESIGKAAEKSQNEVDKKSISLIELCKTLDININDVAASGIRIRQEYEYEEKTDKEVYVGVNVSRSVEITLRDISKYKNVMHSLVASKVSENISTRLSLSNEKIFTDKALSGALMDATQRAQSIAALQNVKLGKIYSVSEFNLRQPERYLLRVSRKIEGQSSAEISAISAEDIGSFPDQMVSESLQRISGVNIDPFDAGSMKATAQVYVVFLVK